MYDEEEIIDYTKLKYALYVRKSTDDPQRQIRSIPDQISECKLLARRIGLHIAGDPIIEKKSAKRPHQRPQFTQMLKDIRSGKYDGIIAWNPDRLARNMKEGGEIIDMVDDNSIQDMRFVTHHFSKDANGKMLLGMAFVLSKQYSDNLSQNVTRGVRKRLKEGKTQIPKHGYINENGVYKPDEENFKLIQEALILRSEGQSIESIVKYINDKGYKRVTKSGREIQLSINGFSNVCKDSFYCGVLIQASQSVDLTKLYDFQPAISEETYFKIQQLSRSKLSPIHTKYKKAFYPLKGMIICSFCHTGYMVVAPSKSRSGKRYLYFRCDNDLCTRKKKSIRAKIIFEYIYSLFEGGLNLTEKEYREYYDELKLLTDDNRLKIRQAIYTKEGLLKSVVRERKGRSLKIIHYDEDNPVWKDNNEQINILTDEEISLKSEIAKLREQLTTPEDDELSLQEFLNLSKEAATITKFADVMKKDFICRFILLNLVVDEEKVLSYQAKPAFEKLLKTRNLSSSRGERT